MSVKTAPYATFDQRAADASGVPIERTMKRGDSLVLTPQVLDAVTGAPKDITGWTLWWTAKYFVNDPDTRAAIAQDNVTPSPPGKGGVVLTSPTNGKATVSVAAIATRQYPDGDVSLVYDLQVEDGAGNTFTVETGTLTVTPDVTRAIGA